MCISQTSLLFLQKRASGVIGIVVFIGRGLQETVHEAGAHHQAQEAEPHGSTEGREEGKDLVKGEAIHFLKSQHLIERKGIKEFKANSMKLHEI